MDKKIKKLFEVKPQERFYELVVVFKPFLPDKVRLEADAKVEKIIEDVGGSVKNKAIWGKRFLAYAIKGHKEGYYILYYISLPSDKTKEVEKHLNRHSEVLRFLMIKFKELDLNKIKIKAKKAVVRE